MRKSRSNAAPDSGGNSPSDSPPVMPPEGPVSDPDLDVTGRTLVLLREDALDEGMSALNNIAGLSTINTANLDSGDEAAMQSLMDDTRQNGGAVLLDKLGIAVVEGDFNQVAALNAAVSDDDNPIIAVEPERYNYALTEDIDIGMPLTPTVPYSGGKTHTVEETEPLRAYLSGYRDAVNSLVEDILSKEDTGFTPGPKEEEIEALLTEAFSTWGLQLTRVVTSRFTGRGVRLAVLDTGMDLRHPDFAGRIIRSQSFVPGQTVQDGHGHGTHCIGTACGPKTPPVRPRYGCAFQTEIYVGKVLSNQGSGREGDILNGINWAIRNGCRVISMSLGAVTGPSPFYEAAGQRALAAGTLIVAAAGNNGQMANKLVGRPANSLSIMAVGAVDINRKVAPFSAHSMNVPGGKVDIAGPGVNIHSSWPMPRRYNRISGTSMATPHVAGIAAMLSQATGLRGAALWQRLIAMALPLGQPANRVGAGLVQAPQ